MDLFEDLDIIDVSPATVDSGPVDASTVPGSLWCEIGQHPFEHTGRGRKPANCPDHKTRTGTKIPTGARRSTIAGDKRLKNLTEELELGFGQLAGVLVVPAPITGVLIAKRAPKAAEAIVMAAKDHPRVLAGIEMVAKTSPWLAVGQFAVTIGVALSADFGVVDPYAGVPEFLGISKIAEEIGIARRGQNPDKGSPESDTWKNPGQWVPPPAYIPIS